MEWTAVWAVAERVSNWLYEPLIFWSLPLVLALIHEGVRGRK